MNSCIKYLVAAFVGALLGIVSTLIISSGIIEICINRNFSFYFGFLFIGIGALLFWRNHIESKAHSAVVQRPSDHFFAHRFLVYFVSLVSIVAGVLCVALRKDWYVRLGASPRMLFLVMLAVSFSFLVIFIIVDIFNCVLRCCTVRPVISGRQQTYLTILGATAIGFIYSVRLGLLAEEDIDIYKIALLAMRREGLRFLIGILVGGIVGMFNEIVNRYGEDSSIKAEQDS
eukprot:TRINITY_DN1119_c0_g1_i1.p1 TRINITY_DN1119_c0_g1~~TRINITY_DN1119_c0_g1_i1.p1  ORF type:complete len:230 (+),score=48.32 TRINITY_DN1119_c0_g1_i1:147-836(+)